MKTYIRASEIHELLDPNNYTEKLVTTKDNIGIKWTNSIASSRDVRKVLSSEKSYLLFPQGEKESYYPAEDSILDGLSAKVNIEGVLYSYYQAIEKIKPQLKKATRILISGISAGTMTYFMLKQALPDTSFILTDVSEASILGLVNLAKSGYDIIVVPHKQSISDSFIKKNSIRNKKIIYTPWSFDSPIPNWINNFDLFMGDNSIVYTNSEIIFNERIQKIFHRINEDSYIVVTELNRNNPESKFNQQKLLEIKRFFKRLIRGEIFYSLKMLNTFWKAIPTKTTLEKTQLATNQVKQVLKEYGHLEEVGLLNNVTLMHILHIKQNIEKK